MGKRKENKDRVVLKMFLEQWMESLENLEKEILKLEIHADDLKLINTIFSRVHNLKRGASFVGVPELMRLCYELEITLGAIRDKRLAVTSELIDGILLVVEQAKTLLGKLHKLKEGTLKSSYLIDPQKQETLLENLKALSVKFMLAEESETIDGSSTEPSIQEVEPHPEESREHLETEEFAPGLVEYLKEKFLSESTEHIEEIENNLLIRLDQDGFKIDALQDLSRTVHNLKEGSGTYLTALSSLSPSYLGVKEFSEVAHTYESLLTLLSEQEKQVNKEFIELSHKVVDYAKEVLNAVVLDDWRKPWDQGLLEELQAYMEHIPLIQEEPRENTEKENPESEQRDFSLSSQENGARMQNLDHKPLKAEEKRHQINQLQSIRVNQEKLDQMMNMISELVIAKNSFLHLSTKLNTEYHLPEISKEVKQVGSYVNRISDELQNAIMSIRMVEIKYIFQKMPRVVRDIAQATGKKMELIMEGETTEIDKMIVEQISDPLIHLIRNAADHGIETSEQRLAKGKSELGKIVLRAYNKNKQVYIEIEDDGKGMDGEQIKEKAISKGFITREAAEKMSPHQLLNLIFYPGFSTAPKITEVSGRGVGMDIVKSNIAKINGTITIESKVDVGTKMTIQLPLTLAVSQGLIVEALGESYIFPLEYIVETVKINPHSIHEHEGKCFTHLRGEVIAIEWLTKVFLMGGRTFATAEELNAVIITNGQEKCALIVDKFKGEQEFVVKTFEGHLANIPGISGSTILGNGKVILIVNPLDIFKLIKMRTGTEANHE